jgi:hypothetical protein
MSTVYDYLTMAVFAGLIVLYLQRSVGDGPYRDSMWQYLVPSVGCATANYLGNEGYGLAGVLVFVATLGFIYYVLKPFERTPKP